MFKCPITDGGRYQEEGKSRESNKVYREDEESTRESRSSIDKVMLSIRNSVFKERPVKKLTERYVELYKIKEVVSKNTVKLKLPTSMRIHLVVNISRIEQYKLSNIVNQ